MYRQEAGDVGKSLVRTEEDTSQSEPESYGEPPDFQISFLLPRIIFKSIKTEPNAGFLRQLAIATKRRFFYLTENWHIDLSSERYPELCGEIVILEKEEPNGPRFEFDGASIPVPWLISLLTIGILRPLGVLLIASIVHDYAFRFGHLWVKQTNGTLTPVSIRRHTADDLFRDIITVVNGNRIVGQLAWYFVRLGYWIGVKYSGKFRTGARPYAVLVSFLAVICLLSWAIYALSFASVAVGFLTLYLLLYLATLGRLKEATPN